VRGAAAAFAAYPALSTKRRRYGAGIRSNWRRIAHRVAVPVLASVVIIETIWLAMGNPFKPTPQTNTAADVKQSGAPPAEKGASTNDDVTWQAALAENAAGLQKLSTPPTSSAPAAAPAPVAAAVPTPVAAPGSVSISLPFQVEIYEGDRFVGLNTGAGIRLGPGAHRLTLVNESLRYRATQSVNVSSGRTTGLTVTLPTGTLQLNATPWAEVFVDGRSVGETPLGNVPVPIGQHTLVFRHPELGEQSRSVVVTAESSTRVSVDLQRK
jgi:serine/threonine-protein kinase